MVSPLAKSFLDDPDELAALIEGVSHPFRVAILNELRAEHKLSFGELRRRVAASYENLDFRALQFHLFKMQMAGIVEIRREEREGMVTLLRDVRVAIANP